MIAFLPLSSVILELTIASICGRIVFLSVAVRSARSHTPFAIERAFASYCGCPHDFLLFSQSTCCACESRFHLLSLISTSKCAHLHFASCSGVRVSPLAPFTFPVFPRVPTISPKPSLSQGFTPIDSR